MPQNFVQPTTLEIASNRRDYENKTREIERLTVKLERLKKTLRCSYCGAPHYCGGYCAACYMRVRSGKPLVRKGYAKKTAEKVRQFARTSCYKKVYGTMPTEGTDMDAFATFLIGTAQNDDVETVAKLWLLDGISLEQIGTQMKHSKQWCSQRIDSLCRFARKAINNK